MHMRMHMHNMHIAHMHMHTIIHAHMCICRYTTQILQPWSKGGVGRHWDALGTYGKCGTVHFLEDDPDPSKRFGTDTIAQQAAHDHDEPVP
jgi:hypothetical protein